MGGNCEPVNANKHTKHNPIYKHTTLMNIMNIDRNINECSSLTQIKFCQVLFLGNGGYIILPKDDNYDHLLDN